MSRPSILEPGCNPSHHLCLAMDTEHHPTGTGWLAEHLTPTALFIVGFAFCLRLYAATGTYFNPDEALHYELINQPSAFLAYKASLTNAHPPLLYLIIYFWHILGHSEWMLRMPLVLAGTGFCWFLFKWMTSILGKTAGMIGLIVAALCPALVTISAEVRQYALLLLCMAAALYFLERAFAERSAGRMWSFSVWLYLAILSHYSAVFFAGSLGLYCLVRFADGKLPRKLLIAWGSGQAGALAIYGFLYITHVSKLNDSIAAWDQPFYGAHFHPQNGNLADFTWTQTSTIFYYLFQQPHVSWVMLFGFLAGVVLLFVRGLMPHQSSSRHFAILLVLPFTLVWGAGVAGIYPYLGSRHTICLAPFAIASASALLAAMVNRKLWLGIPLAAILMVASNAFGTPPQPYITRENQERALMTAAVNDLRQSIPPGDLILMDLQSSLLGRYYLCDPSATTPPDQSAQAGFTTFTCGGHLIAALDAHVWRLTPGNFGSQFTKVARAYGLHPGDRVWVFESGWGVNLDLMLRQYLPDFRCITSKRFGENIATIPFLVGADFLPAAPIMNCND